MENTGYSYVHRESKGGDGVVRSFATISLDSDEGKVLMHHHARRGASIGELQVEGNKVIRTDNWKRNKLSKEQIESRVKSFVANRLASGAVQEEGVSELKKNGKYLQRTSGTDKNTYEKQGSDKMVTTFARKNESGQFVLSSRDRRGGGAPAIYTRKSE